MTKLLDLELRQLLDLPFEQVANLEFHELAALAYRDSIPLKHMKRTRLAQELEDMGKVETEAKKKRQKAIADSQPATDVMAETIIEHLLTEPQL